MATTWMKALHRGGGSIAALGLRLDYAKDFSKTDGGILVDSYECDVFTAQQEFLFSKKAYAQRTGRDQGRRDVIAYHVRMSFKPGEVTPQQALELGRELALRWTKGRHQFIVAAHTNTNSPHTHIVFNSVNLACDGKFEDFKRSAIALRRVSDRVCLEHGLSIIEKPGLSKGYNRAEYLGESRAPTVRDQLRGLMDDALEGCKDYDSFLAALQEVGVEMKRDRQLAFKLPGGKKFVRQDTLGEDYSSQAVLERISGKRVVVPKQQTASPVTAGATVTKPNLLIDIQEKMQQGYGEGYRRWATTFNLKESAKTLLFLQEHGLDDYGLLAERAAAATTRFNDLSGAIKTAEKRLAEIATLQKHIGAYGKTREVYRQYRALPQQKRAAFFEGHRADISVHIAAKEHFDSLGYGKDKKLPAMDSLRREYAVLDAERRKLSQNYKSARDEMVALQRAKQNVDSILGGARQYPKPQHLDRDAL